MGKDDKRTFTPRLRFPEFRDAPGWDTVQVSEILTVRDEKCPPTTDVPLFSLTIEDGVTAKSGRYNREFLVADPGNKKYKLVQPRDIVYNPSNLRWGAINYSRLEHAVVVSPIYEVLYVTDTSATVFEFVARALMRPEQISRFITKGQGTLVERIAVKIKFFLETSLSIPPSPGEQGKIAECLRSLDELIAAEGRKLEALKAHKKGLTLQLFPREDETLPRLRLPEFRCVWEDKPLFSLAKYENGKAYEQEIQDDGRYVVVNSRFISTDGAVQKYSSAEHCIASEGDVLVVLSDLPKGRALAKCFYVDVDYHYAVNQRVARLTPTAIHPKFLYYRLNRHPYLLAFDDGLNQTHLSKGSVSDCPLRVPTDQAEQQWIADCLSALDVQIAAETEKLSILNTHKKGLIQQLFPSPEGG